MQSGDVLAGLEGAHFYLRFVGDVRLPWCVTVENYCQNILNNNSVERVSVDLNQAENLDSTTLGVLAKVALLVKKTLQVKADIYCIDKDIERLINSMGFASVFNIKNESISASPELAAILFVDCDESKIQDAVIDAHKTLIDIDETNRERFDGLVKTLEKNKK